MIQKRLEGTEEKQSNQGFKSEFEKLRSEKVEEANSKVVNFYLQVGCGCGGNYEKYHAEVPIGQDIDDGDYISDFEDWMSNVERGWV